MISSDAHVTGFSLIRSENGSIVFSDDYKDCNGHGNECYKIISKQNRTANFFIIKVFSENLNTDDEILAEAIQQCVLARVDIINISAGVISDVISDHLREAIELALRNDTIIVAAMDNGGRTSFPASYDGVIGVGYTELEIGESYRIINFEKEYFFTNAKDQYPPDTSWAKSSSFACAKMTMYIAKLMNSTKHLSSRSLKRILIEST